MALAIDRAGTRTALVQRFLFDVAIVALIISLVDGELLGQGHGSSKGDAQEVAAGMTLASLLSGHRTATPVNPDG